MPAKRSSSRPGKSEVYTRTGDKGTTALFGGSRVRKDSARVEAYGSVDELNSTIGVAVSFMRSRRLKRTLEGIQNELFNIGAELASETTKRAKAGHMFSNEAEKIAGLERLIDEYDAKVPKLRTFILPSGSRAGALLHLSRTVCRRAEREVVRLSRKENVNPHVLTYLNRLSDLLFVLARYTNKSARKPETAWKKG
jgi:cob(I)alamin adenosyltransferase